MQNPQRALFSDDQWSDIHKLLEQLGPSQTHWLRDYLNQHQANPESASASSSGRIAVVFGSETGNSKGIAEALKIAAAQQGKSIELLDLARIKVRQLPQFQQLFIVCSTHGDGDPPEPVEAFYTALMASDKALPQLEYAVLALGDSSYEKFCETGIQLDQKLEAIDATRLLSRVDCDVDYQEQSDAWIDAVISRLPQADGTVVVPSQYTPRSTQVISKNQPLEVEILENLCLSAPNRERAIHHIELDLNGKACDLQPGDSIGIFPQNPPPLVNRLLALLDFSGDESVTVAGQAMPLVEAMREHRDLNVVSAKFIKRWADHCTHPKLHQLANSEASSIRDYLKQHQLCDILVDFGGSCEAQVFIDSLRPLQPRLYDVANSLSHTPGECHLTVERYLYKLNEKLHKGIASHFLCDLGVSETVRIYPQANKRFRLPSNKTVPLILVADSTGIAPYRAFLEEYQSDSDRQHPVWLVFQEEQYKEDFLYQIELQQALEAGHLSKLDSFFAADMPGQTLFDCVVTEYETLKGWFHSGAHLYLSGHKSQLESFQDMLVAAFGSDPGMAHVWQKLSDDGRIHRNFY